MKRLGILLLLAIALAIAPQLAHAQVDPSERALKLAYEADELFAKGRWDACFEKFAQAEKLAHSPVFVLYKARCRRNAGRLLEARDLYHAVAQEQLAADAPKPFERAVTDARDELNELGERIPSLEVKVQGTDRSQVSVSVDGKPAQSGVPITLDPGLHKVQGKLGDETATESVQLSEGQRANVVLRFGSDEGEAHQEGSLAPAIAAFVLGGVGLILGAVTGGIAASMTGDIKEGCIDDHCLEKDADKLDTAKALATTSTVGFIVGGAGVAAGVVLVFARPGGSDGSATAPWWLGVAGRF